MSEQNMPQRQSIDTQFENVYQLFRSIFGDTTDSARLRDIMQQTVELCFSPVRRYRIKAYGKLLASLAAFAGEQGISPAEALHMACEGIREGQELYRRRGSRKEIAILGGSFDPPTIGHVAAAKAVLNSGLGIHEVWFMPANEYFGSKTLTPAEHRIAMVRMLEAIDPRFKCFAFEVEEGLFSETISTVLKLLASELVKEHRFRLIVSVETANTLRQWPRAEELIHAIPFITVPRVGYEANLDDPWFLMEPHRYLHHADGMIEAASSDFRVCAKEGDREAAGGLAANSAIFEYAAEHGLYGL